LKTYKRIEINTFRRRVIVVSREWPGDITDALPAQFDPEIFFRDSDTPEPVVPSSPEGQLIIVEALRSLEKRLSPEARMALTTAPDLATARGSHRRPFSRLLKFFFRRKRVPRFFGGEK